MVLYMKHFWWLVNHGRRLLVHTKWALARMNSFCNGLRVEKHWLAFSDQQGWLVFNNIPHYGIYSQHWGLNQTLVYLTQKIWIEMHSDCMMAILPTSVICVNYWWKVFTVILLAADFGSGCNLFLSLWGDVRWGWNMIIIVSFVSLANRMCIMMCCALKDKILFVCYDVTLI